MGDERRLRAAGDDEHRPTPAPDPQVDELMARLERLEAMAKDLGLVQTAARSAAVRALVARLFTDESLPPHPTEGDD